MVSTVEPGIYIYLRSPNVSKFIKMAVVEKCLPVGEVRLEDDILIMADIILKTDHCAKG